MDMYLIQKRLHTQDGSLCWLDYAAYSAEQLREKITAKGPGWVILPNQKITALISLHQDIVCHYYDTKSGEEYRTIQMVYKT